MGSTLSRPVDWDDDKSRNRDEKHFRSRHGPDIPRFQRERRSSRRRRESHTPFNFHRRLATASMTPNNKRAPLWNSHYGMIRIRALQHMNVINLRRELAALVAEIVDENEASPEQMEKVRKTLKHYVTALRDLKYMLEPQSQNKRTADFLRELLYISKRNDSAILLDVGLIHPSSVSSPILDVPNYTGHGGFSFKQDTKKTFWEALISRIKMALFGGVALIAPMLIMRLHPGLVTELVTTSVFVVALALILAWYMTDASEKDILGATAAYAAVLVVFVGTSSTGS